MLKNSVRSAKKTHHFTVTKIKQLMLFNEIIAVYSENHKKLINKIGELVIVDADGTQSYN
jgi:hypothetical protein